MEKTIIFDIPEGYVIDNENSTDTNIVLKLIETSRPKTWQEYCAKMSGKESYYTNNTICGVIPSKFGVDPIISEFDNKEDAEAFEAYSKLLKLRKNWIGNWKPKWANDYQKKYIICNYSDIVAKDTVITASHCLSFPTPEMRDEFFDCFQDYLEQAKDLI